MGILVAAAYNEALRECAERFSGALRPGQYCNGIQVNIAVFGGFDYVVASISLEFSLRLSDRSRNFVEYLATFAFGLFCVGFQGAIYIW
jgi:hypothetical protein